LPQVSIGSFLASSFNEHINSKANHMATKRNVSLDPAEVDMPVVLSINRSSKMLMRGQYPDISEKHFNLTAITLTDNTVVEADDSD
jgi:hypothetical protein